MAEADEIRRFVWFLTRLEDVCFFLEASDDPLDGGLEVLVHDGGGQLTGGDKG